MTGLTSDPNDPRIRRGSPDETATGQLPVYLVLSEVERAEGFIRPFRQTYKHLICGSVTKMGRAIAETYARDNLFYGNTFCVACSMHRPVSEFVWDSDGTVVGS